MASDSASQRGSRPSSAANASSDSASHRASSAGCRSSSSSTSSKHSQTLASNRSGGSGSAALAAGDAAAAAAAAAAAGAGSQLAMPVPTMRMETPPGDLHGRAGSSPPRAVKFVPAAMPFTPGPNTLPSAMHASPTTPGTLGYSPAAYSSAAYSPAAYAPAAYSPAAYPSPDMAPPTWAAPPAQAASWQLPITALPYAGGQPSVGWVQLNSGPAPPPALPYQHAQQQQQQQHVGTQYLTGGAPDTAAWQQQLPQHITVTAVPGSPPFLQDSLQQEQQQQLQQQRRKSTGGTFPPSALDKPTRVLGTRVSPVDELNPITTAQKIRLKHRANTLIQRYAGTKWREAQRAKWLVDIVCHIDRDYREYLLDQAHTIQHLHSQLQAMQRVNKTSAQEAQMEVLELSDTVLQLQAELRDSNQVVLQMRGQMAELEKALEGAEAAANIAANECVDLQEAVHVLAQSEARTRKSLAQRAVLLKDGLVQSQGRARQLAETQRRHNFEVTALCHVHDEQLTRDKRDMERRCRAQVAAVQSVEQAAAQMAVDRVKMELEAYKEPWKNAHGNKSPTQDVEVAKALGLKVSRSTMLSLPKR